MLLNQEQIVGLVRWCEGQFRNPLDVADYISRTLEGMDATDAQYLLEQGWPRVAEATQAYEAAGRLEGLDGAL